MNDISKRSPDDDSGDDNSSSTGRRLLRAGAALAFVAAFVGGAGWLIERQRRAAAEQAAARRLSAAREALLNHRVVLEVSGLGAASVEDRGPFGGSVIAVSRSDGQSRRTRLLVKLDRPMNSAAAPQQYLVVSPARRKDRVEDLLSVRQIACRATQVAEDVALSDDPFDFSRWRGGATLLGDLSLISIDPAK